MNAVINEQIRRLARREIKSNTKSVKKSTTKYRHSIATLKQQMATLTKRLAYVERQLSKAPAAAAEAPEKGRFRAIGVKAHRSKLGLSANEYGKLVGVSGLTIYNWESGKARPRNRETAAKWLAIRGLGKKEALQRLGLSAPGAAASATPRKRGRFPHTAEQTILGLLNGKKSLATSQINQAWKKEGRSGTADVTLGLMVKAKKLKRTKVQGQRGSMYSQP